MKVFFTNLGYKIKAFFKRQFINSYGMDALNKTLICIAFVLSLINLFVKSSVLYAISLIFFVLYFLRYFSKNKIKRASENRAFTREIKFIKLKKQYIKTHRVYKCKKCGQFIKVPKGAGSITTTCPSCGNTENHRA